MNAPATAAWPCEPGYDDLVAVLKSAYEQAAYGKGKERHAGDGIPFAQQRMQATCDLLGNEQGMAYQAIKKLTEGLTFTDPARVEAELFGAINYIAGVIVWRRRHAAVQDSPDTTRGEETCGL